MNACEARGGYEKRGGGAVFRSDTKSGGGCLPYDDLYSGLCARA